MGGRAHRKVRGSVEAHAPLPSSVWPVALAAWGLNMRQHFASFEGSAHTRLACARDPDAALGIVDYLPALLSFGPLLLGSCSLIGV